MKALAMLLAEQVALGPEYFTLILTVKHAVISLTNSLIEKFTF